MFFGLSRRPPKDRVNQKQIRNDQSLFLGHGVRVAFKFLMTLTVSETSTVTSVASCPQAAARRTDTPFIFCWKRFSQHTSGHSIHRLLGPFARKPG